MKAPGSGRPRKVPKARRMMRSASPRSASSSGRIVTSALVMADSLPLVEEPAGRPWKPRRVSPTSLVIHAHFYQPPRENPWTEEVPREPSAAPFHDWNARISAESYRPNAYARIFDGDGGVLAIVNNYEELSFNIGPTLMSWLEPHQPDVYGRIQVAEAGGGAIAQAWNHMILPLANERDTRTQIRWGLADYRHRLGREAATEDGRPDKGGESRPAREDGGCPPDKGGVSRPAPGDGGGAPDQ